MCVGLSLSMFAICSYSVIPVSIIQIQYILSLLLFLFVLLDTKTTCASPASSLICEFAGVTELLKKHNKLRVCGKWG